MVWFIHNTELFYNISWLNSITNYVSLQKNYNNTQNILNCTSVEFQLYIKITKVMHTIIFVFIEFKKNNNFIVLGTQW